MRGMPRGYDAAPYYMRCYCIGALDVWLLNVKMLLERSVIFA